MACAMATGMEGALGRRIAPADLRSAPCRRAVALAALVGVRLVGRLVQSQPGLSSDHGLVRLRGDRARYPTVAAPTVVFDSDEGKFVKSVIPQGQNAANTFTEWITAIHMADVWGIPWRVATALLGLMLAVLSITGFQLWLRKRSARKITRKRHGR